MGKKHLVSKACTDIRTHKKNSGVFRRSSAMSLFPKTFLSLQKPCIIWHKIGAKPKFSTRIITHKPAYIPVFYFSKVFIVGIESRISVSFCIIKYYPNFLNFFATYYHALFCIMQAEIVALLLYLQNPVALQHIHQGLFF